MNFAEGSLLVSDKDIFRWFQAVGIKTLLSQMSLFMVDYIVYINIFLLIISFIDFYLSSVFEAAILGFMFKSLINVV